MGEHMATVVIPPAIRVTTGTQCRGLRGKEVEKGTASVVDAGGENWGDVWFDPDKTSKTGPQRF
jgi:hypothetical protein